MTVAVFCASGKTGRAVTAALRSDGEEARPVGRAEFGDLAAALRGCRAAYVVAPNLHPDEPAFVTGILDACRRAGTGQVVYHSVAAPFAPGMPHHVGKAHAEDAVRRSGLEWTILQPCAYVQNLIPGLLAPDPVLRVPYDVDRPFGLVDLDDVAASAVTALRAGGHAGATYELGGPALSTVRDVARCASGVLGREVAASRVDPRDHVAASGLDTREREWLLAMFGYYDRFGLPTGPEPMRALLGRAPCALRETLGRELGAELGIS